MSNGSQTMFVVFILVQRSFYAIFCWTNFLLSYLPREQDQQVQHIQNVKLN